MLKAGRAAPSRRRLASREGGQENGELKSAPLSIPRGQELSTLFDKGADDQRSTLCFLRQHGE